MVRSLPFKRITAFPRRTASTVMYGSSETRMPQAQMVSMISASRSFPSRLAVLTSEILFSAEIPVLVPEHLPLDLQEPRLAVLPANEPEQRVQGGQLAVHRPGAHSFFQQRVLPPGDLLPAKGPVLQPVPKLRHIPQILFHRAFAPLLISKRLLQLFQHSLCYRPHRFATSCIF